MSVLADSMPRADSMLRAHTVLRADSVLRAGAVLRASTAVWAAAAIAGLLFVVGTGWLVASRLRRRPAAKPGRGRHARPRGREPVPPARSSTSPRVLAELRDAARPDSPAAAGWPVPRLHPDQPFAGRDILTPGPAPRHRPPAIQFDLAAAPVYPDGIVPGTGLRRPGPDEARVSPDRTGAGPDDHGAGARGDGAGLDGPGAG